MPSVSINPDSLHGDQLVHFKPLKIKNLFEIEKFGKQCLNSIFKCPGRKKCCDMGNGKFGCCKFEKVINIDLIN